MTTELLPQLAPSKPLCVICEAEFSIALQMTNV